MDIYPVLPAVPTTTAKQAIRYAEKDVQDIVASTKSCNDVEPNPNYSLPGSVYIQDQARKPRRRGTMQLLYMSETLLNQCTHTKATHW
mmetsp:Transcript_20808/g.42777  ORF Transcript_20808/g.42777 Transcript_20808/m.42777 type:complete len:88 (-) Transcript_20808:256-519(-)